MLRHVIPVNVSSDGNLFGGIIKKRNALEAGIVLLLGIIFFKVFAIIPLIPKIVIFFIVFLLPAGVAAIGINDQSVVEFLFLMFNYKRRSDIIPYQLQVENVEEVPTDIFKKHKYKKEKRKKKKAEKKASKQRLKEFDKREKEKRKAEARKKKGKKK